MSQILLIVTYCYAEDYVSEDWKQLLEWNGDGGFLSDYGPENDVETWSVICLLIVISTVIVAILTIQVGLFRFRRWARAANLYLTSLSLLAIPFLGLSVSVPFENFCAAVGGTVDGAILAMTYLSPVRREFTKSRIDRDHRHS